MGKESHKAEALIQIAAQKREDSNAEMAFVKQFHKVQKYDILSFYSGGTYCYWIPEPFWGGSAHILSGDLV